MTDTQIVPFVGVDAAYVGKTTPLKSGGRFDVEVSNPSTVDSFQGDITSHWRAFFEAFVGEVDEHAGDPVALANALARAESLLADVRFARDHVRTATAMALKATKTRKLTVEGVITVEGTGGVQRTDWQHRRLLAEMLEATDHAVLDRSTGEVMSAHFAADRLLEWFRPEWKMTPVKAAGLKPDEFCTVLTDEDDKPVATPTVRIVDNVIRRMTKELDDAAPTEAE